VTGCTKCPVGLWSNNVRYSSTCSPIACDAVNGLAGLAGQCTCAKGYSGTVRYVNGVGTGCKPCPAGSWAPVAKNANVCVPTPCLGYYAGTAGQCTCAAGHYGTVYFYESSGKLLMAGCAVCPWGTWSTAGNGNVCESIKCPAPTYFGMDGQCYCAQGYYGPVSYSNGQPTGCTKCPDNMWTTTGACTAIKCNAAPGYYGSDGQCMCQKGFYGTVSYSNGLPIGCASCPAGKYANGYGMKTCTSARCDLSGDKYTGTAGACECAEGYSGIVEYNSQTGALSGCT
jgi:hypothetical protein